MMTASASVNAATQPFVSSTPKMTQNETRLSELEILRRVRSIRSSWTVAERMERREEAGKRFAALIDALSLDHQAA